MNSLTIDIVKDALPREDKSTGIESSVTICEVDFQLPACFIRALDDFEAGRVVDMEIALTQPPPHPTE